MEKNLKSCGLLLLVLTSGWTILVFQFPFSREIAVASAVSIVILCLIHDRYSFFYTASVIVSFGAYLIVFMFRNPSLQAWELYYITSHLLLTVFIVSSWIMISYIKNLGYETERMKRELDNMRKTQHGTDVLTPAEFASQAVYILKAAERNRKETWLLTIDIGTVGKRMRNSLLTALKQAATETIREKYDLVTSTEDKIFILLKDTDGTGAECVLRRYQDKMRGELNFVNFPFEFQKEQVFHVQQLRRFGEATV
ncbi:hypothetical protein [Indiicoccus explosivorum]|uniref:hypothetical protein n=1 Tax=Indiicoccus explosivorum TaxID=1917864 RepID=UPI000B446E7A|nr:hypothetical protein [Indiicoccus explosivorum]